MLEIHCFEGPLSARSGRSEINTNGLGFQLCAAKRAGLLWSGEAPKHAGFYRFSTISESSAFTA